MHHEVQVQSSSYSPDGTITNFVLMAMEQTANTFLENSSDRVVSGQPTWPPETCALNVPLNGETPNFPKSTGVGRPEQWTRHVCWLSTLVHLLIQAVIKSGNHVEAEHFIKIIQILGVYKTMEFVGFSHSTVCRGSFWQTQKTSSDQLIPVTMLRVFGADRLWQLR